MAYFGGVEADRPWPVTPERARYITAILGYFAALAVAAYVLMGLFAKNQFVAVPEVIPAETGFVEEFVLVANQHVPAGTEISNKMFDVKKITIDLEETRQYVQREVELKGTYTKALILEGDPLLRESISVEQPILADVSMSIPAGYRAVAIPVNPESGVEGWVRPGVHVDIVWTTDHRAKQLVSIIVENARVLSAGGISEQMHKQNQKLKAQGKEPVTPNPALAARYVTLMVSLEDSQKINLAKISGSLALSLRGAKDQNAAGDSTLTVDKLLSSRGVVLDDQVTGTIRIGKSEFEIRDNGVITELQDKKKSSALSPIRKALIKNR